MFIFLIKPYKYFIPRVDGILAEAVCNKFLDIFKFYRKKTDNIYLIDNIYEYIDLAVKLPNKMDYYELVGQSGHLNYLKLLLKFNADSSDIIIDKVFKKAIYFGHLDMIKWIYLNLRNAGYLTAEINEKYDVLELAVEGGNIKAIDWIFYNKYGIINLEETNIFELAAEHKSLEVIKYLYAISIKIGQPNAIFVGNLNVVVTFIFNKNMKGLKWIHNILVKTDNLYRYEANCCKFLITSMYNQDLEYIKYFYEIFNGLNIPDLRKKCLMVLLVTENVSLDIIKYFQFSL